jgi:hypothetical protein
MKSVKPLAALIAVLTCIVLDGCGGGSGSTTTQTNTTPPAPTVSSLSPSSVTANSPGFTLTVSGTNFVPGSEVSWQGTAQPTLYQSATSLQIDVAPQAIASPATIQIAVQNPQSDGGTTSSTIPFLISADNAPNPLPVLTSITPNNAQVGSTATTITLTGSNFIPESVVELNGATALTTDYISSTSLSASIPSANLGTASALNISVTNPAPGGGASAAVVFTVNPASVSATEINVTANDLAWDPVNQVIYLSLPSLDGSDGNALQVLNPSTGNLGANVFAGSEPDLLAVSSSSQYLYVALDGASSVQRFALPDLTTDINISFGPASFYGPYVAMDLQASPASDGTVAFVLGTPGTSPEEEGGVHIYDNSTPRPNILCGWIQIGCNSSTGPGLYDSIQWSPAAGEMYILNNEDTGFDFYTVPVTANGFGTVTDYGALAGGFYDALHYDATTNLLYTNDGVVINPQNGTKAGQVSASGLAVPDGKNGLLFYLGQTQSNFGSSTYTIESFDINHLTPIATYDIQNVSGTPTHFIRWGTNGLAFTTAAGGGSTGAGAVYLVSGSFVTTNAMGAVPPAADVQLSWKPVRGASSGPQK